MESNIGSEAQDFFAFTDIGTLMPRLIDAAIIAGALAALIYFIMGGITWITSGGDAKKTEEAQKHLTNAVIGLVIVVAAFAIFQVVKSFLGLDQAITTP